VTVIWRRVPKTIGRGHFGGRLAFAPDGKLFITSGERQRFEPAQDMRPNLGKIVRINPDGSIPEDNPFVGQDGARADIWSLGHRNQLGAAFRPETSELWVHEMGPKDYDELNLVEKGKNYGWPYVSEASTTTMLTRSFAAAAVPQARLHLGACHLPRRGSSSTPAIRSRTGRARLCLADCRPRP
jgi:glucose/arabinose dehydrogenase